MPQVQMPDGAIVEMPDNLDPELAGRLRALQLEQMSETDLMRAVADSPPGSDASREFDRRHPPEASAEQPGFLKRTWDDIANDPILNMWGHGLTTIATGAPETALTLANNGARDVIAGLGGMLVDPTMGDDAADFIKDFQSANTYVPKGDSARQLTEGLGEALAPYQEGKQALGETVLEKTDSPLLATLANIGADVGLTIATAGSGRVPGAAKTAPARELLGDELAGGTVPKLDANNPVTRARRAGYPVLPSDAQRLGIKTPGRFREKLAPTDVRRDMVLEGSENTKRLAREEIGLPEGTWLDEKAFAKADEPHIAVYREGESKAKRAPLSPEFQDLLAKGVKEAKFRGDEPRGITRTISALRARARKFSETNNPTPQNDDYAESLLDLADAIEGEFGKHLEKVGEPGYIDRYRAAREAMAKINDLRQAERGGQIDPAILRKRADKGSKLSGRLKMMAEANEHFGDTIVSPLSAAGKAATKEPTATGLVKDTVTGLLRKIPGLGDVLDIRSPGFQNKLGRAATPEEESYFATYGQAPGMKPAAPRPEMGPQQEMLGSAFEFEAPPGDASRIPLRDITQQAEEFQPFMDLVPPPGRVGGRPQPRQMTPEEEAELVAYLTGQ